MRTNNSATMNGGAGGCHWNSWQSSDGIHSGIRCGTETCEEVCRIFLREQSVVRVVVVEEEADGSRRRRRQEREFPFCVRVTRLVSFTHGNFSGMRVPVKEKLLLSNHCDLVGHVLHHSEYDNFASVNSLHWNEFHTVCFYRWCLTATLFLMFVRIE